MGVRFLLAFKDVPRKVCIFYDYFKNELLGMIEWICEMNLLAGIGLDNCFCLIWL